MKNFASINHFIDQANACRDMGSEFTATLCEQLIDIIDCKSKTGNRIENWPGDASADALALRLCGGLHSIVISNPDDRLATIYSMANRANNTYVMPADYCDILACAIQAHDGRLLSWLDHPPQTNETGRAAALLPGLLHISRHSKLPLHLCEIGASAGLNLQLDRFYYRYGDKTWGNADGPVHLVPEINGALPNISGELKIISRIGCDLSPLDIADDNQRLRLQSYIWPDQGSRSDRLNGAIKLAIETSPKLLKIEAAEFVERQLSSRPPNVAFVLMHSVVWQYLPQQTKRRIEHAMRSFGSRANASNPVYWLRLEGFGGKEPAARLTLDNWPNHCQTVLAQSCFHGNWIEFL